MAPETNSLKPAGERITETEIIFRVKREDTYGLVAFLKPADLDLYESFIHRPIEMPDQPQVCFYFLNVTLPSVIYLEGAVTIRVRMEGREGWHLLDLCVDRFLPWIGNYFLTGYWKKFLADKLISEPSGDGWVTRAIEKDDRIWLHMQFKPGDVSEMNLNEWQRGALQSSERYWKEPLIGFRKASRMSKALHKLSLKLDRGFEKSSELHKTGQERDVYILDTTFTRPPRYSSRTGKVRIRTESSRTWTRLVPPGVEAPGMFVRFTR